MQSQQGGAHKAMSAQPRQPHELNHVRLFDAGSVKTRLDELTAILVSEAATAEMKKRAMEAKRNFQEPPSYDLPLPKLYELFGEQARKQSQEILEMERKAYADSISDYVKRTLTTISKQLRLAVYTIDENGKLYKLQVITEKMMKADHQGNWDYADVQYVGNHDYERLHQIGLLQSRINEFRDYAPYFDDELKKLWKTANDLSQLETVKKEG
jgi:hypothetical protein